MIQIYRNWDDTVVFKDEDDVLVIPSTSIRTIKRHDDGDIRIFLINSNLWIWARRDEHDLTRSVVIKNSVDHNFVHHCYDVCSLDVFFQMLPFEKLAPVEMSDWHLFELWSAHNLIGLEYHQMSVYDLALISCDQMEKTWDMPASEMYDIVVSMIALSVTEDVNTCLRSDYGYDWHAGGEDFPADWDGAWTTLDNFSGYLPMMVEQFLDGDFIENRDARDVWFVATNDFVGDVEKRVVAFVELVFDGCNVCIGDRNGACSDHWGYVIVTRPLQDGEVLDEFPN